MDKKFNVMKLVLILFATLLSLAFVNAGLLDGIKNTEELKNGLTISQDADYYPAIQLKDNFGLPLISSNIADIVLVEHTASCNVNCVSEGHTTLYKDMPLFDKFIFYTINYDENGNEISRIEQPIRNYQVYIKTGQQEIEVPDYENVCTPNGIINSNGTEEQDCNFKEVGSHIETKPEWTTYNIGDILPSGSYDWELRGNKRPDRNVDWIATVDGKDLTDLAVWGGNAFLPSIYYKFNSDTGMNDSSGNGENLTLGSGTLQSTGKLGGSLLTGGTSNGATLPFVNQTPYNLSFRTNNFTIALWVNISKTATLNKGLLGYTSSWGSANAWASIVESDGKITWRDNGAIYSASSINTSTWHRVVFVREGTGANQFKIYIDGSLDNQGTLASDYSRNEVFEIGGIGVLSGYIAGSIDDIQIHYGTAWSLTDITNDWNGGAGTEAGGSSVTLNSPQNNNISRSKEVDFNCSAIIKGGATLTNMSFYLNNVLNETKTKTGTRNESIFTKNMGNGNYNWTCRACDSDGDCGFTISNYSLTIRPIIENSQTYNLTSNETKSENFNINISSDGLQSVTASLVYNGTTYSSTKTGDNYEMVFSRTIDIPLVSGVKYFYWDINYGGTHYYSYTYNQTISPIYFGGCNSTLNIPYLNITFQDESSLASLNASLASSNFDYYLGDGTVYKTYQYSTANTYANYTFCASPANLPIKVVPNIQFQSGTNYPKRRWNPTVQTYTNKTTNKILYLLQSLSGIYSSFNVVNGPGNNLEGATISAAITISGVQTEVDYGVTDASGLITLFLDPTVSHIITANYPGLTTYTATIIPTQSLYTINLGGGNGNLPVANGTSIGSNLTYTITPESPSLLNDTIYSFGLNVLSNDIIYISENITNSSGYQLGFISGTNGLISVSINTTNQKRLIGTYTIQTSTETLVFTRTWIIGNYYEGDYSLSYLMKSWDDYDFYDYYKVIIMLLILVGSIGGLSALEITDTSESKIGVGVMIVWIFSYVGWLTINISVINTSSPLYNLNQFANQYGIAILATAAAIYSIKEYLN